MVININKSVFNTIYLPFLGDCTRLQIFYGGSSSGKTVALAQRAIVDILKGGRNYLIVRKVNATLRTSVFNDIKKLINSWGLQNIFRIYEGELKIIAKNGYSILFKGLDDVEKIKGITPSKGTITDIWLEEATETTPADFKQLKKRLRGVSNKIKRIVLSFNPILQTHWIYKDLFGGWQDNSNLYKDKDKLILRTTYKDNSFLSSDDIEELENETDKYWRDVYTLGHWGTLGGVIFNNWKVQDLTSMIPTFDNYFNGLDFGYGSSPSAMVVTHYDKKRKIIYVLDEIYQKELTNQELAPIIRSKIGKMRVVCDSAEPKSIRELVNSKVNAVPAKKGQDSINHGIQWLQGHKIVVNSKCQNMINELSLYQWKTDASGEPVSPPKPVKKNDHLIDALRYSLEEESNYRKVETVKIIGL